MTLRVYCVCLRTICLSASWSIQWVLVNWYNGAETLRRFIIQSGGNFGLWWKPVINYRVCMSLRVVSRLSHINPLHILGQFNLWTIWILPCNFKYRHTWNILITRFMFFNYLRCVFNCWFYVCFRFFYVLLSILCVVCFCIVLCVVSPNLYFCFFSVCVQAYQSLPPGGNQIAISKYHIFITNLVVLGANPIQRLAIVFDSLEISL